MIDELVRQAESRLQAGDVQGAYDAARRVLSMTRSNGRAHYLLSRLATIKGAHDDALKLCRIAVSLDGETGEYLGQLSVCLAQSGRRAEAHAVAVKALSLDDLPGFVLEQIAFICYAVADWPLVLQAHRRLLALQPDNAVILANIGATLFLYGRTDEAKAVLADAIRRDPNNVAAYSSLCGLRTARADDNHVAALKALLETETDLFRCVKLHHALASEYFDLDQAEEAFACLKAGKDALLAKTKYTVERDIAMFAAINRFLEADLPAAGASSVRPIFVVGMPRSGTTVVERILTNCRGVVSIGESIEFVDQVRRRCAGASARFADAGLIDGHWRRLPYQEIGEAYADFGNALSSGADRFVDKLPLNLLFAPLIVKALPNARIVCLSRHPLDTVLGNYSQLLEIRSGTFDYASSLAATARYVVEAEKLAAKMAERHPQRFLLVRYEDLVTDAAAKGRQIARFCGLPWREEAVRIENNTTPVGSASAAQVRAPIHARYIGRWKQYRAFLGEAIGVLDAHGVRWD